MPPDLHADRAQALALTPVSRETAARLDRLVGLLLDWQGRMNLVARSTLSHVWTRHVADSLQLLRLAPEHAGQWLDLGSGAGFPGLVIACALADRPGARVHLIESVGKKVSFLRAAVTATGAPALVHHGRIEDLTASFCDPVDVLTARALAPLEKLLGYAYPVLKGGALGLFPKGQDVGSELAEATRYWEFDASLVPSLTAPGSRIVVVKAFKSARLGQTGPDRRGLS